MKKRIDMQKVECVAAMARRTLEAMTASTHRESEGKTMALAELNTLLHDIAYVAGNDERVTAVRRDKVVGEGSCSSVDEAMTDVELYDYLEDVGAKTAKQAVAACRRMERLQRERAEDARATAW